MCQKRKTQKNRKPESLRFIVSDENKAEGISIEHFPLQTDYITDHVFKNETVQRIRSSSAANSLGNTARYVKSSSAANRSRSYAAPEANAS